MGGTPSKPNKSKKYQVTDQVISEKLVMLSQLLEAFKTNNDGALDAFFATETFPLAKKDRDALRGVVNKINTRLGKADKSSLDKFVQTFKHVEVEDAIKNLLNDPYFQQAPADKAMVEKALRSVENIAARENFYMYQYIQLNAYLPMIFSILVDINTTLYKDVSAVTIQYTTETQRILKLVEAALVQLQKKTQQDISPEIETIRKSVADSMNELQKGVKDQLEAAKTKSDATIQTILQESANRFKSA